MKVFTDKLRTEEISGVLINCRFHGNQWTSNMALYLKMLVLVTAINCLYQKAHNLPEISSYAARLILLPVS